MHHNHNYLTKSKTSNKELIMKLKEFIYTDDISAEGVNKQKITQLKSSTNQLRSEAIETPKLNEINSTNFTRIISK